jgi:hypothetical protein
MQSDPKPGEDFPMICETCLGNNPYMRMTKLPFGSKICKISNFPYQPFRWKAGTHGRFKETIISYTVAKEKNICQACLNDMKYGLPVGVRDAMLRQQAASDSMNQLSPVHSLVGTSYHYQQLMKQQDEESVAVGGGGEVGFVANEDSLHALAQPQQQLLHTFSQRRHQQNVGSVHSASSSSSSAPQRSAPEAIPFRNLPKLCTFWLAGSCRRVMNKSCPFRPCCGVFQFPELAGGDANMREANHKLIAQLQAEGPDKVQRGMEKSVRQALHDALKRRKANSGENHKGANVDESIRARVYGTDELSQKYLAQLQGQVEKNKGQEEIKQAEIAKGATDPAYLQVKSLWIGNLPPVRHEQIEQPVDSNAAKNSLRHTIGIALQRFGVPVVSISIAQTLSNAFVEYPDHTLALHALQLMMHDPPLIPSPILLLLSSSSSLPTPSSQSHMPAVKWQALTLIRWATPPSLKRSRDSSQGAGAEVEIMPAPPGMERMHPSAYSLPNAPPPHVEMVSAINPQPPPPPPPLPLPLLSSQPHPSSSQSQPPHRSLTRGEDGEGNAKRRRVDEEPGIQQQLGSGSSALGSLLSGYGSSEEDDR